MTQYCEGVPAGATLCPSTASHVGYPNGGALAGIWRDTATAAPTSATSSQIANEAIRAAAQFGNVAPESNRNAQYVIASPTGTYPDGFNAGGGFCAWHDSVYVPAYGDIAFTNLPYVLDMGKSCGANFVNAGTAGLLDGVTMVEGHEYAETITDQIPAGGWTDDLGLENADKCAWISGGLAGAQNVAFATGVFPMQTTWSNEDQACRIVHPIFGVPGPDDFAILVTPRGGFAIPGDAVSAVVETATVSGNPQAIDLSVSGVPPDATASVGSSSIVTDDSVTLLLTTSSTTPYGTYPITITATGSVSHTATYTLTVGPLPSVLDNGVTVEGIADEAGSEQFWVFDQPDPYPNVDFKIVDFTIAGGVGDADLFVRQDALPTDDDYDCASRGPGNLETCVLFPRAATRWYVRVHGAAAFSGLTLKATYPMIPVQTLNNGRRLSGLRGTAGSQQFFRLPVPQNVKKLKVTISGGGADLYLRRRTLPSPLVNDCAPIVPGQRSQHCTIQYPWAGHWYIGLYGWTDFDTLRLRVRYR